jgi:hypothetical protein
LLASIRSQLTVYFYTVVQDQGTIVALYYCITSLPVYPNTVCGHCTSVVLDTSNSVYCIATLMEMRRTVYCTRFPNWAVRDFYMV